MTSPTFRSLAIGQSARHHFTNDHVAAARVFLHAHAHATTPRSNWSTYGGLPGGKVIPRGLVLAFASPATAIHEAANAAECQPDHEPGCQQIGHGQQRQSVFAHDSTTMANAAPKKLP